VTDTTRPPDATTAADTLAVAIERSGPGYRWRAELRRPEDGSIALAGTFSFSVDHASDPEREAAIVGVLTGEFIGATAGLRRACKRPDAAPRPC
jgi:hypothetical protein